MQFNERLKKLRLEKGVTQKELADAVYVSRSAVAKWENGLGLPNEESLKLLAEYFHVEEKALLSDVAVESVIVEKNGTMSRQKQWIFSLLAIVCALIVVTVVVLVTSTRKPVEDALSPIVSRELIFESERYLDTSEFPVYSDDEISPDAAFAHSRTFEVTKGQTMVEIPNVCIRERRADGSITFQNGLSEADLERISISNVSSYLDTIYEIKTMGGHFNVTLMVYDEAPEYERCFNIHYEDLTLSMKVFRDTLAYESVEIIPSDGRFVVSLASSKTFDVEMSRLYGYTQAYDARIQSIRFPDGRELTENLEDYAYLKSNAPTSECTLYATAQIPLWSKVFVEVSADRGRATCVHEFEVIRVAVESVKLLLNGKSVLRPIIGESYSVSVEAYPANASFNVLQESFFLQSENPNVTLERTQSGWTVNVSNDPHQENELIMLECVLPEGKTVTGSWRTQGVLIEEVRVKNANTEEKFEELKPIYVHRGDVIPFQVEVLPENATYTDIEGMAVQPDGFMEYFDFSKDGVLTVRDDAPYGMELKVSFRVWKKSSSGGGYIAQGYRVYTVRVQGIAVERVEISAETTQIQKLVSGVVCVPVTVRYFPENAEIHTTELVLLDEIEGVELIEGTLLVEPQAKNYTRIQLKAIVNGVESAAFTFTVMPPPLQGITIEIERVMGNSMATTYQIKISPEPWNADASTAQLVLLDDIEGVFVIGTMILVTSSRVKAGTVIRVQAISSDGLQSNILTIITE